MANQHSGRDGTLWSIEEIPYHALLRERVCENEQLFYIVACASFIEITSSLYTRALSEFFRHDRDVVEWLEAHWEHEELQHGAALKRYVEIAWPEFDWERGYRGFFADYAPLCSVDQLAPTRALEMVARCVVETGTASFYRMLSELAPEPVLRHLAARISVDEVRHYKYFYRYFRRYRERERPGRLPVLRTLWRRAAEVHAEDVFYAFKHAYLARHPGAEFEKRHYETFRDGVRRLARHHFPRDMAMKMLLKPLGLSAPVGRLVLPAASSATQLLLLK
jgi:hypothetical protein